MRHHSVRVACGVLALAALPACDLTTPEPPPPPPIDVSLDFCSDDIPIWVAYQQNAGNWVRLTPDVNGTVSFSAEYKVAIATVHQNASETRTEVIYTTNNLLAGISGRTCREESGTKTLNGSVTGYTGTQAALVSMGVSSVYRAVGQNTFTLTNLPTRPLDIIASRVNFVGTTQQHANKTILRRSQNLVGGSTVPVLDFDAAEAIPTTAATVMVSAMNAGDEAFVTNNFFSQLETSHVLTYLDGVGNGSHQIDALPTSALGSGDYHDVFIVSVASSGHVRGVERYFRTPGSHALALGPELANPVVSTIATSPYLRTRTILPIQADYPSVISVRFDQQLQFSANTYILTITNGYPDVAIFQWDLPMDPMTGAPGWQDSWGLQNGDYEWSVTAYGARAELLFGAAPQDNELVQYGIKFSTPANAALMRRSAPPRPTMLGVRPRRR